MRIWTITVTERLSKTAEIKAETEEEALEKAKQLWMDEEILITDRDFEGLEIRSGHRNTVPTTFIRSCGVKDGYPVEIRLNGVREGVS